MWNSKIKIFGMPLLSVGFYAHGFIAIGWAATGIITIAQFGAGIIAITQFGIGVVSVSQFTAGFITLAQGGIGVIVSIGQGALGFAAIGFDDAAGYYVVKDPRSIARGITMLYQLIAPDPALFLAWSASWFSAFLFFFMQTYKLSRPWSFIDFFRPLIRHTNPKLRLRALEAVSGDKKLFAVASRETDPEVMMAAARRIGDAKLLARLAAIPACAPVHTFAVCSIENENLLFEIALASENREIAGETLVRITDQGLLMKIAEGAKSPAFRGHAIARLESPGEDFLLARARAEWEPAVLIPIIKHASTNAVLVAALGSATSAATRITAIRKFDRTDQSLLAGLLMKEEEDKASLELAALITNRELLLAAAGRADHPAARTAAIRALDNPAVSLLRELIGAEKNLSVCEAALMRISDAKALGAMALDAARPAVAMLALARIDDRDILGEIASRAPVEGVRAAAKKRIDTVMPVYYSFKIDFECPSCSQPVFVNGPLTATRCRSCLEEIALDRKFWKMVFETDFGTVRKLSHRDLTIERTGSPPRCPKCGEALDTDDVPAGTDGEVICASCATSSATFPVPEGFSWIENAEQVFCGEREGDESREISSMKPVAVSCIRCGAPLTVSVETPRNATCGYCKTVQYLPDSLWLSLHPVKTRRAWYIRYNYRVAERTGRP